MKVTVNCNQCKKNMLKQAEEQYAENQYEIFNETIDSAASWSAAIGISVLIMEGKSPEEIKKFFEDFCFLADTPEIFGKKITMEDTIKRHEKEFGISFNDIRIHHEGKKRFLTRFRKAQKEE